MHLKRDLRLPKKPQSAIFALEGAFDTPSREDRMRQPALLLPIALALGAATLVPGRGAQADPTAITACQTINQPGSYKLVGNLAITGGAGCLIVAADDVTIDLAGFSIIGQQAGGGGIQSAAPFLRGIAVRNGSISGFASGVALADDTSSIVEGIRVSGTGPNTSSGIIANGIVKGNVVSGMQTGIQSITGTITDNYVENFFDGILAQAGSTLIGNTVINNIPATGYTTGLVVTCPSNVINNTATGSTNNLFMIGDGCNNTNNVAP
jgi:hypothetical protein